MVGSGVWVMVGRGCNGLWLKWVVGRGSAKLHTAFLSSLIVDWWVGFRSVGWDRLMVGLKRWICWSVGLIIGSSDGGSGDDFFLMGLLRWVSNRLGFKSAAWVSDRWLGWWVWWPLFAPTGLMVCVCVALLMVWWFVFVCVALLMDWWFVFVCVCGSLCVVMGLDRLNGVSWVCVCGTGARGWGRKRGWKAQENQVWKKSDGWKEIIKKD